MTFAMKDVGRQLVEADIRKLERKLGLVLPEDYKVFLLKNNGGRPIPKFFPIEGFENNPQGQIQDFFGLDDPIESCRLEWNYKTFAERLPQHLFPIACEDGGSLICLSLSGSDKGAVYYWDLYGETQPPSYDNVYPIAETFKEFLDSLHSWDPLAGEEDVKGELIKRDLPH
ncbi:MAG: SMI1/KNR4 family protein [Pseudomonadota bacterium]